MKWLQLVGALLLSLTLGLSAQAQGKKNNKKNAGAKVVEAEEVFKAGQKVAGKVIQATESSVRIKVEYEHLELKPQKGGKTNYNRNPQLQNLIRQQQQIARAQQKIATARTPQARMQAIQSLQRLMQTAQVKALQQQVKALQQAGKPQNSPFKVVKESKDFDIELDNSVVYRTNFLPYLYDDMGERKKFSAAEMKELRGNGRLPGYKALASDVKPGAMVAITFSKNKETENKLRGTLVLITAEGNEPVQNNKGGKRKPK